MILQNVMLMDSDRPVDVKIEGDRIKSVSAAATINQQTQLQLRFDNAFAFPGLINSHDHLDFNLFPQLGNKVYNNYTEWGAYIHQAYQKEIAAVLKIPVVLREQWGVLKNLICGVTTVVNHGERIKITSPLINVHERYHCLHSVGFEKRWRLKLNNPLKTRHPVVIHTGEGKDGVAHAEINQLIRWNLLRKKLVGVHGVAMESEQAQKFKALVWCPQSNFYLLNKTAPVNELQKSTTILFGTDSTLTGDWDIWAHIRTARETKLLADVDLYHAFNHSASEVWETGSAAIEANSTADLIVVKAESNDPMDSFFNTRPEDILMVMQAGHIRLYDETLAGQLNGLKAGEYHPFKINGKLKYVQFDVSGLMNNIKQYYPQAIFPISAN